MSAQIVSIGTYLSIALIDTTCISFSKRSEISKARLHVMIQIKSIPYKCSTTSHSVIPSYFRMTPAYLALFYYGVNFC